MSVLNKNDLWQRVDHLERENAELRSALRYIARQGGNLSDKRHSEATGPRDAAYRGNIMCGMRAIARKALDLPELGIDEPHNDV